MAAAAATSSFGACVLGPASASHCQGFVVGQGAAGAAWLPPKATATLPLSVLVAAATSATVVAWGWKRRALARRARRRGRTTRVRLYRGVVEGEAVLGPDKDVLKEARGPPADLYELLGVDRKADSSTIKKAYYEKQKICHPDVAGEEGEEICILLNDAYDVLSKEEKRAVYDDQLRPVNASLQPLKRSEQFAETELEPTWNWAAKRGNRKPVWTGSPQSLSRWDRVKPEDRGLKHAARQFAFVDEVRCISCRNCCDIAPRTFCIDAEAGRARVFAQWGNSEEYLDYAIASCPVDCISWVERGDLSYLEFTMVDYMYENAYGLPCPMTIRQGTANVTIDVYSEATSMKERLFAKEQKAEKKSVTTQSRFASRISEVFNSLGAVLRNVAWGY